MGTVTINGSPHTIYGTLADATAYINATLHGYELWAAASVDQKARALVSATHMLNRQRWEGSVVTEGQALAFPRTDLTDAAGDDVSSESIPDAVISACFELAIALLANPNLVSAANIGSNIKIAQAGSAIVQFFRPVKGTRFPVMVHELIGCFMSSSSSAPTEPYVYDTGAVSAFEDALSDDDDEYTGYGTSGQ